MWDYFSHSLPLFVLFRKSDFSGLRKAAFSLLIAAGLLLSAAAASAVKLLGLLAVRRTLARICVLLLVRRIRVRCYGRRGRDINTRRRSNAAASAVAAVAATTTSAAAAAADASSSYDDDGDDSYSAPSYSEPSYSYEEPSYSAPSYSGGGADTAIATAKSYLGVPYVWGGESYGGVDCSGLTMLAWGSAGVDLPHLSRAQYGYGTHVPIGSMEAGDLIFWSSNGTQSGIYHVAIYLGGGQMIEAPTFGVPVRITGVYSWGSIMPYAVRL